LNCRYIDNCPEAEDENVREGISCNCVTVMVWTGTPVAHTDTMAVRAPPLLACAVKVRVPLPVPEEGVTTNQVWSELADHVIFEATFTSAILFSAANKPAVVEDNVTVGSNPGLIISLLTLEEPDVFVMDWFEFAANVKELLLRGTNTNNNNKLTVLNALAIFTKLYLFVISVDLSDYYSFGYHFLTT